MTRHETPARRFFVGTQGSRGGAYMHNSLISGRYCYNGHLKQKWLSAIIMAMAFEFVCWFAMRNMRRTV
jgi:hypothetical protein